MLDSLISGVSPIEDSKLLNAVYYEITQQVRHARKGNSKLLSAPLKQGDTTQLLPISNILMTSTAYPTENITLFQIYKSSPTKITPCFTRTTPTPHSPKHQLLSISA